MLKTLLTSVCERDCYYCPFRKGRDMRRATFKPDELAATYMHVYRTGRVEGIFLSSGIVAGGIKTQDKLIATAELLREKHEYKGYIHLKIMPGAEKDQVYRAMQLADRVSVNLEAPNTHRLHLLAPLKQFSDELVKPLQWVEEIRNNYPSHYGWNGHWPSSVTQFVVGAVGESDLELLNTTAQLYSQNRLKRTYSSAFDPIENTPLENVRPTPPLRQHRLYQASFLLRDYDFSVEELPFIEDGTLPLTIDPKKAWADIHLTNRPIEINLCSPRELIRIPGVGPVGARHIIQARRERKIRNLAQLHKLGIQTTRLAPYILLNGKRPPYQQRLI